MPILVARPNGTLSQRLAWGTPQRIPRRNSPTAIEQVIKKVIIIQERWTHSDATLRNAYMPKWDLFMPINFGTANPLQVVTSATAL